MTRYPLTALDADTRLLVSWQRDFPIGPVQVYEISQAGVQPVTHNEGRDVVLGYPALLDHQIFTTTQQGNTGKLYVVDRERRIERELGANSRVKHELWLSPDGRTLAYWEHPASTSTGGELVLHEWKADQRTIFQPGHRILDWHWSPQSDSVVGISWGGKQTPHWYRYALDGTEMENRPLVQFEDKKGLTLSPDWQYVAYLEGESRLMIADLSGQQPRHVGFLNNRETPPVWSPDGKWLAWAGSLDRAEMDEQFDLCIAGWSTHERGTLMALNEDDENHAINPGMPVWSANGRRLAIDSFVSAPDKEGMAVFLIDINTRAVSRVTDPAGIIFKVAWI